MIKKLINFYLFRTFKLPEIDRSNDAIASRFEELKGQIMTYNDKHDRIMSMLILNDPNLYNELVKLKAMANTIDHLSDALYRSSESLKRFKYRDII